LHFRRDDGIVVVGEERPMYRKMTVATYLAGEETNRPQELAYGVLREPAAPSFQHQIIVGRIYDHLHRHVRRRKAGVVVVSPVDVILDREKHLVVQPDVVFIRAERLGICTDRIWGAPDLVVEVLSTGNLRHDRTVKVAWYAKYGVPECWLVDTIARTIDVIDLTAPQRKSRTFEPQELVRSNVLPHLRLRPASLFGE
jgi:Uma2 family endonuclease